MSKLIPITDEKDLKSRLSFKQTFKSKKAWLDGSKEGKPFIVDCMNADCPVEVMAQAILENGVEYLQVRIYFKTNK